MPAENAMKHVWQHCHTATYPIITEGSRIACTTFAMTPEEALAGITFNAARALDQGHGSLEQGKSADVIAWDIQRPAELACWLGGDLPKCVIRHAQENTAHG
ncbi:hypothetical protein PSEUDO8Z_40012 [Pseudomonas sp. 8Z]|nr:hypothetical protein PSEUDO8Z_40012 [Pseudomonas sp. 8Z]